MLRKRRLDIKPRKKRSIWTPADLAYLKINYHQQTNEALAKRLNKTPRGVIKKARELGLDTKVVKQRTSKLWTEKDKIVEVYRATKNIAAIAQTCSVSYNTIVRLLRKAGEIE